jgi:transcriptional regulator GlxA family with amidase domain
LLSVANWEEITMLKTSGRDHILDRFEPDFLRGMPARRTPVRSGVGESSAASGMLTRKQPSHFAVELDAQHVQYSKPAIAPTVSVISQLPFECRGALPPSTLCRVNEYIDANFARKIDVQALADIAKLSIFHFSRTFKQSTSQTPHRYVIRRRVRHAEHMLVSTDLPVAEIALVSGFSDQSHLTRCFGRITGITPGRFRWLMR